jgi:thioredoxin-related protein
MKSPFLISTCLFLAVSLSSFSQTGLEWQTDLVKAQELSKSTNKPIFGFFTGSDWCGWCKKLQREVFAKPEFIEWAQKNVILLELDFPRKTPQSAELAQQNAGLQQAFQVQGFPTVWLFFLSKDPATNNFNISALGSLGYPGGAEPGKEEVKFISNANAILANNKLK